MVRDLITAEQFDLLYGPWKSVEAIAPAQKAYHEAVDLAQKAYHEAKASGS